MTCRWQWLAVAASFCFAQSPPMRPALPEGGGARLRLVSIFIPNLPNAPFTATVNTEWVRTLGDGSHITLMNHRLVARDSAGRVFQERRMLVPQNSGEQSGLTQTEISDPVLKQQLVCDSDQTSCVVSPRDGFVVSIQKVRSENTAGGSSESLGSQTIGGLEAVGTRETAMVPQGAIGNDVPIKSTREVWFSPKLGLNLITVRDDPRFGSQRFDLSDNMLGEPDPKLFLPPAGSRVVDQRRNSPEAASAQTQN